MADMPTPTEPTDPMKLTIEHLESIGKIWGDFAKAKLGPYVDQSKKYVDQSKKWVEKYRKPAAPESAPGPAATDAAA